jgi:hypothetical protein
MLHLRPQIIRRRVIGALTGKSHFGIVLHEQDTNLREQCYAKEDQLILEDEIHDGNRIVMATERQLRYDTSMQIRQFMLFTCGSTS